MTLLYILGGWLALSLLCGLAFGAFAFHGKGK